jgi:O-antigen ligase
MREFRRVDALVLGLAFCAVPLSIAVTESLLCISLAIRTLTPGRDRAKLYLPSVFRYWLAWAALEVLTCIYSAEPRAGLGEIRHLLLIAVLFLSLSAFDRATECLLVWRGIFLTATLSSAFLIGRFVSRILSYRGNLDPVVYLRSGGLLHHWMIYAVVEILVVAGLLEFWHLYPEERSWLLPIVVINSVAIVLSLTRMLWFVCLLLLALHLIRRRSRWIWTLPVIPLAAFLLAPSPVRTRVIVSLDPDYYSNAERLQMLRVGWQMVRDRPLTGVGPGRVEGLYRTYLSPSDPVPAYHGHLHNNLAQLAAEFGLPVTAAALLFIAVLFRDLLRQRRRATERGQEFLCNTALLGLTGFLSAGMFDYTYGHSLALILLCFAVLMPLFLPSEPELGFKTAEYGRFTPPDRAISP